MPRSQAILIIKFTATTTTQNAIHRKRLLNDSENSANAFKDLHSGVVAPEFLFVPFSYSEFKFTIV
ncbi:hypothetical protein LEP1GSC067_1742 [Leptospira interrogans serovar Lora str. TE 1992]|uniref:Uncharacterized protein n=1 Tax=Leptospira interrogans serovar Lora str. TE 1992 TaxID=1193028 RepID=M3DS40_LEPIR|nr:hypothetical protein LEP1GSC067_1742 [Leptospira interrogans serovar Lora str. TE 1992]